MSTQHLQNTADLIDKLDGFSEKLAKLHQEQSDIIQSIKDDIQDYVDNVPIGAEDVE